MPQSSPPGLTRGSICFARAFWAKTMDCRVKPGNDKSAIGRTNMRIQLAKLAATLALAVALPGAAGAQAPVQSWPQRSIKMIVPFPAGGGPGFNARLSANHLSERLRPPGVREHRDGGH